MTEMANRQLNRLYFTNLVLSNSSTDAVSTTTCSVQQFPDRDDSESRRRISRRANASSRSCAPSTIWPGQEVANISSTVRHPHSSLSRRGYAFRAEEALRL